MISGILTSILMLTFLGLWAWAWSNHRRVDFSEAAHIPLEDDSRPYPEDKPCAPDGASTSSPSPRST